MKIFFRESIVSFVLSVFLIFILSIIISKTTLTENIIVPGIILISSISIMFGSIRISKNKKQKGMIKNEKFRKAQFDCFGEFRRRIYTMDRIAHLC